MNMGAHTSTCAVSVSDIEWKLVEARIVTMSRMTPSVATVLRNAVCFCTIGVSVCLQDTSMIVLTHDILYAH